jgi:hypothetical protein
VEWLSVREKERIAELLGEGAPFWRLRQEVPRSRDAIHRAVMAMKRPSKRKPNPSPLRLSLAKREEISRGSWPAIRCGGSRVDWVGVD